MGDAYTCDYRREIFHGRSEKIYTVCADSSVHRLPPAAVKDRGLAKPLIIIHTSSLVDLCPQCLAKNITKAGESLQRRSEA